MNKQLLDFLDKAAYNRPERLPEQLFRNDKLIYRLYFRFMCLVYILYRNGVLEKESLADVKKAFTEDFLAAETIFSAAAKSVREYNKSYAAYLNCRKNSDSCEFCKKISEIYGQTTRENEPDIEVQNGV